MNYEKVTLNAYSFSIDNKSLSKGNNSISNSSIVQFPKTPLLINLFSHRKLLCGTKNM